MSTYRKEWDCCGSVTETEKWEPATCPICFLEQAQVKEAAERKLKEYEVDAKSMDSLYFDTNPGSCWIYGIDGSCYQFVTKTYQDRYMFRRGDGETLVLDRDDFRTKMRPT